MAVRFLPQAQFRAPGPLDFSGLHSGLDQISATRHRNALLEQRQKEFDANEQHRRAALDMQRARLAKGPELPWWVGKDGSVHPAMQQYRTMGRPLTTVNVNSQQQPAFSKEVGKQFAQEYIGTRKAGAQAQKDLNDMKVLERALADPKVYTGTFGNTVQSMKKAAQSLFGVPVEGVASGELAEKLSKRIAIGLQSDLPLGRLSDGDRQFLVELAPGLSGTPEGNRQIVKLGQLQKQYQIEKSRAAMAYASRNNNQLDQGFDRFLLQIDDKYAKRFSNLISSFKEKPSPRRSPAAGFPQLKRLYDKYGLE